MIQARTFEKNPNDEDSHPLKDCYEWALAHCMQTADDDDREPMVTPMLIVQQQYGDANPKTPIYRRFKAFTLPSFISFYTAASLTDAQRHCDEIIGLGPCKAYCDFETEAEIARDKLEASAKALIDEIVAFHRDKHGVSVRPVVHTAHKTDKWSMHVTFAGSVWRSAAHFGAYMKDLVNRRCATDPLVRDYVDVGVYGRFRGMRMPRSTKLKEPGRSLLAPGETAQSVVNVQTLADALITVFRITPPGAADGEDDLYVTTAFLDRYPDMITKLGLQPIEWAGLLTSRLFASSGNDAVYLEREQGDTEHSPLDAAFKTAFRLHFTHYRPQTYKWNERDGALRVECNSKQCVILKGEHDSNHVYLDVNVLACTWRHGCYSEACKRERSPWRELPEDVAELCRDYRARWRYATKFPSLAALVGGIKSATKDIGNI